MESLQPKGRQLPQQYGTWEQIADSGIIKIGSHCKSNLMLYNALVDGVGKPGLVSTPIGRKVRVVELASGNSHGVHAIVAFFSGVGLDTIGMETDYVSIDINPEDVNKANEMQTNPGKDGIIEFPRGNPLYPYPHPHTKYLLADATDPQVIASLLPRDVGIMRHPAVENQPEVFETILTRWLQHVPIIIVTCGYESEYEAVLRILGDHVVLHGSIEIGDEDHTPHEPRDQDAYIIVAKQIFTRNPPIILTQGQIST